MAEIETNLVNIKGIVPGYGMDSLRVYPKKLDGDTQISVDGYAVNNTSIIYTVTAGKVLHLCSATVSCGHGAAVNGAHNLLVRNGADVVQYYIYNIWLVGIAGKEAVITFNPPLEIPAGYDIVVQNGDPSGITRGYIFGFER